MKSLSQKKGKDEDLWVRSGTLSLHHFIILDQHHDHFVIVRFNRQVQRRMPVSIPKDAEHIIQPDNLIGFFYVLHDDYFESPACEFYLFGNF